MGTLRDKPLPLSRRDFLMRGCSMLCALSAGGLASCLDTELFSQTSDRYLHPASHWRSIGKGNVQCELCPNICSIIPGGTGACRARVNRGGRLYSIVYSRIATAHIDPVEKKPLFHFLPGTRALSVATAGCNLSCRFCQNWQLSQSRPDEVDAERIPPASLVAEARGGNTPTIAFTYNEPTVQFEYVVDTARAARARGIKSVIISNGYIRPAAGREFASALDAIKIDLKAFTQRFYSDVCGGSLREVMANLEIIHGSGRWLEIVVLLIPTLNDSPGEIRAMSRWIRGSLSANVPVHFLRFHPMFRMTNIPVTPVSVLERCHDIARAEGIKYVYLGNVPGHRFENTFCHNCGREIISRSGIFTRQNRLSRGRCPYCGTQIPGVWA
jgi:pyruvate formate lyase activating enzyme